MDIIFVCTGNTCRSPMAEALMREALKKRGIEHIGVSSAGINAIAGQGASRHAQTAMSEYGIDIKHHLSRPLSRISKAGALILCMTDQHVEMARRMSAGTRVARLSEMAGEDASVSDPYGGSLDDYRKTAKQIERYVNKLAEMLESGYLSGL